MRNNRAFTLVEVMIVVLTVAVLAAVLIPMLGARVEAAKWSEGKAGVGTIATAIRTYAAENGEGGDYATLSVDRLFKDSDLKGKYFSKDDYDITCSYDDLDVDYPLHYTVQVLAPDPNWKVTGYTLDHTGKWTEL
jgi:prepilin-type N-terminal cleavage/methylation domain-containing protein